MPPDVTKPKIEILPAEGNELRMPSGTPLGLGILGAARFSAIRRVLDHATRAAQAKANYHAAEGAVAESLVYREVARERLRNLDAIRQETADQITEGALLAKLERKLQRMEIEDRIAEREASRARVKAREQGQPPGTAGVARDHFADFMEDLKRMPEIAKAATEVKAKIVTDAGGEEKLDEGGKQMIEIIDSMLTAFVSKQAEEKFL